MLSSCRAFFEGIIDYAGLFPPASLPVADALKSYLQYQQGPENWMLGRFIIPAARIGELLPFGDAITAIAPLRLSLIGRGGSNAHEFVANVRADLADIDQLAQVLGKRVAMETYEVKLPAGLFGHPAPDFFAAELFALKGMMRNLLDSAQHPELQPFFEYPPLDAAAVKALAKRAQSDEMRTRELLHDYDQPEDHDKARFPRPGWKLRCGGLQADAFPAPEQVAAVLAACAHAGIPWKATAGLHHPLRHFDAQLNTRMHGFVNVFGAGILTHAMNLGEDRLVEMLADEDAGHFRFTEAGLSWKEFEVTTAAIRTARRQLVTSFGSCSFSEPCADLRDLDWI